MNHVSAGTTSVWREVCQPAGAVAFLDDDAHLAHAAGVVVFNAFGGKAQRLQRFLDILADRRIGQVAGRFKGDKLASKFEGIHRRGAPIRGTTGTRFGEWTRRPSSMFRVRQRRETFQRLNCGLGCDSTDSVWAAATNVVPN